MKYADSILFKLTVKYLLLSSSSWPTWGVVGGDEKIRKLLLMDKELFLCEVYGIINKYLNRQF
jgi:hypothetical protein